MFFIRAVWCRFSEDLLLSVLLLALFPLLWFNSAGIATVPALIDWQTLAALCGLMLLSKGLELSGYLNRFARMLLNQAYSVRRLAVSLVLFSALLSAIVTNDVALFIVVPVCLSMARLTTLPIGRLVIFLALAVNAGSAVSPVGNPQNLLLWQASGYSFMQFLLMMAPLAVVLLMLLLALTWWAFPAQLLARHHNQITVPGHSWLFRCSLAGYLPFIVAMEWGMGLYAASAIIVAYLFFYRQVLRQTDWMLLLIFTLMFIDLGLLAGLPLLQQWLLVLQGLPGGDYTAAALLSQLVSNVPAAIFMQHFSDDWRAVSWGVAVGGFGLLIGSLANLIALRLVKLPGLWREFHLWSVPVFLLSLLSGAALLALSGN